MATLEEDEDNFAEDECTIEFGEEDPPDVEPSSSGLGLLVSSIMGGPRFMEYPGEDYSKYLSESALPTPDYNTEDGQVAPASDGPGARRRYIKNNVINNNAKSTIGRSRLRRPPASNAPAPQSPAPSTDHVYDVPDVEVEQTGTVREPIIPPPASPPASRVQKSRHNIRERVGRIFTAAQSGQRRRSKSTERLGLHNFTFADSKIGTMMLAQRERDLAAQAQESAEDLPETQSDLGLTGPHSWWDVGTLSSNRSAPLKDDSKPGLFRRRGSGDRTNKSNSVPNLAEDIDEDRRSLFGSLSKAVSRARDRRSSDTGTSSPTSTSPTQPTSPAAEPTVPPPPPPLRCKDNQGQEVKVQGDGRGAKRGNLFKRLKDSVGPRSGDDMMSTTRRKSDGSNNGVSGPRYTRIYEEMNRLTTDFRQSTVDNPLP